MKQIPLTQGKFALVDDEDYEYLMQWRWYYDHGYAIRNTFVSRAEGKQTNKRTYMHREILQTPKNMLSDHIDGNKINNQRNNLRCVTASQNSMNAKCDKNTSSGFKGVSWHKRRNKWSSYITVDKKIKYLGYFEDKISAAITYNSMALKHFGEFARLNIIPDRTYD